MLYAAWLERHSFQFLLPPEFAYLDPADPVQLTLANGYTVRGRLGAVELGANYASSTTLLAESDGQYVSTAAGAVSAGILPQAIATSAPSQLFLLDVPLLRPTDDIGLQGMRVYWAASPYVATGAWHGAQLQDASRNPDTMNERTGAWGRLLALFRLVHSGDGTGWIRGRGGALFDPAKFPFLQGQDSPDAPVAIPRLSDGTILRVLDRLLVLDGERLAYFFLRAFKLVRPGGCLALSTTISPPRSPTRDKS